MDEIEVKVEASQGMEPEKNSTEDGKVAVNGAARVRRKLRRFKREEDVRILEAYHKSRGERRNFLRGLAEEFGRPFSSIEKRYYYLMAKGRGRTSVERMTVSLTRTTPMKTSFTEDELTAEWLTLPERVKNLEGRLAGMIDFKEFIERLAEMHNSFEREQALLAEISEKDREIARMKEDFSRAVERLRQREEELDEIHSILENTLSQWMKLSAVDKIKVLGDFAVKLENTVAKLGSVVRRKPIWVSR